MLHPFVPPCAPPAFLPLSLLPSLPPSLPPYLSIHPFLPPSFHLLPAFQNYLRTQAGNTTTVNIITCTVDYLLRLQESITDFYWHYSEQDTIDLPGRENLLKAFVVAKQVFRTLTEYIQVRGVAKYQ